MDYGARTVEIKLRQNINKTVFYFA